MAPNPEPGWHIYKEQMASWCHGDALWQPAPTHHYQRISIGDVGFIRCGQFHLLFSAGRARGERQLGIDVPHTFVELQPDATVTAFSQPRSPGCLHTDTVREIGVGVGVSVSTALPLEPGAYFSYELTGKRGAALVTRHQTYKEDALKRSAFEQYTKKHYDSWVAFSREKQYGDDVKPVLVYGVDMTRDFAMAAYSNEGVSLAADLTISVPTLASASASIWGTWRTKGLAHTNYGPQQCVPPPSGQAIDSPSQSTRVGTVSDDYNQCVFVRYYTMRKRMGLYPTVMRAAAGPHDLGSGDNRGNTFPELIARQHPTAGDEGDPMPGGDEEWDPAAADASSDQDIVIHNTPYDEEYDGFDAIADYAFQNSSATSVLTSHQDLVEMRVAGDSGDISSLLGTKRPRIVVEESGVGRIICGQNRLLTNEGDSSQYVRPALDVASRDYPDSIRDFEGQDINPPSTRSNQDGLRPHTLAPSFRTPIPDKFPTAVPSKVHSRKQTRSSVPVLPVTSGGSASSVFNIQQRLEKLNPTDVNYRPLLFQLLVHRDLEHRIQAPPIPDLGRFVEFLDKALSHISETDDLFRKTLHKLQSTCSNLGVLPQSHIVQGLTLSRGKAIAAGGFTNAHEAELDGRKVFVKALRLYVQDTSITRRTFHGEVVVWKSLRHPNIVPFLGISGFNVVCTWMENGRITEYVGRNPEVDRIDLLWDVADGLHYLHWREIIHSDLKGANVLIDGGGHARLKGFGLTSAIVGDDSVQSPQSSTTNTTTWAAPEILGGGPVSKEGDIFTFSMVAIEAFTGRPPFDSDCQAALDDMMAGKRPKRPETLDHEELWETVEKCWDREPGTRPNTSQLLEFFRTMFPRERGKPKAKPLSKSSTWTVGP